MYDCIIIGMGISGISAGLYAKQANLKTLMLEGAMPGGILNSIDEVRNYTGLINIKGMDFSTVLMTQIIDAGIEYKLEKVIAVEVYENKKIVKTASAEYEAKNVIIATGRRPKFLGLDNEERLLGKGLSTCAVCDGNFFKDKIVSVVGSGNSALQEALYLSNIANTVNLIIRKKTFTGSDLLKERVLKQENIIVHYESNVIKINEENEKIVSLTLNNNKEIITDGLFIYIGYTPNYELVENLNITNDANYILVNENFETEVKGIFAVGDVIKKDIYQLVTAASDGAKAIIKIAENK